MTFPSTCVLSRTNKTRTRTQQVGNWNTFRITSIKQLFLTQVALPFILKVTIETTPQSENQRTFAGSSGKEATSRLLLLLERTLNYEAACIRPEEGENLMETNEDVNVEEMSDSTKYGVCYFFTIPSQYAMPDLVKVRIEFPIGEQGVQEAKLKKYLSILLLTIHAIARRPYRIRTNITPDLFAEPTSLSE